MTRWIPIIPKKKMIAWIPIIPKKKRVIYDEKIAQYICPYCDSFWVCEPRINAFYNFCGNCRGALDWSDTE